MGLTNIFGVLTGWFCVRVSRFLATRPGNSSRCSFQDHSTASFGMAVSAFLVGVQQPAYSSQQGEARQAWRLYTTPRWATMHIWCCGRLKQGLRGILCVAPMIHHASEVCDVCVCEVRQMDIGPTSVRLCKGVKGVRYDSAKV
jgi:hypothetical protein